MTKNLPAAWCLVGCLPVPCGDTTANAASNSRGDNYECNDERDEKRLSLQSADPLFVCRHFCCVFIGHCGVAVDSTLEPGITSTRGALRQARLL